MAQEHMTDGKAARTPPYIAFQTLKTFLDELKQHGVPNRIDRSVLTRFSGAVGSQLLSALKFLGLITEDAHSTTALAEMVTAYGTDGWPNCLRKSLENSFAPVFLLDLQSATPAQFTETFRAAFPAKENVLRKCITFFLNGVRETNFEVSPRILKNTKPRSAPTKRTPRMQTKAKFSRDEGRLDGNGEKDETIDRREHPEATKTPYHVLMNDIYDPALMQAGSDEEKAVFTLARFLKMREAEEKTA